MTALVRTYKQNLVGLPMMALLSLGIHLLVFVSVLTQSPTSRDFLPSREIRVDYLFPEANRTSIDAPQKTSKAQSQKASVDSNKIHAAPSQSPMDSAPPAESEDTAKRATTETPDSTPNVAQLGSSVDAYLSRVRAEIARRQIYPPSSLLQKEEGVVEIRITLSRTGSLIDAELERGSPHRRLNLAALKAVHDSAPFPPFPDEVEKESWTLQLPVRFSLEQN